MGYDEFNKERECWVCPDGADCEGGCAAHSRAALEAQSLAGHPRFYELLRELGNIHNAKNQDYGDGNPFGNFMEATKLGIRPFLGVLVRLTDKYSRVMTLAKRHNYRTMVKDESIMDTLKDMAVYSLIAVVMLEEELQQLQPQVTREEFVDCWDEVLERTGNTKGGCDGCSIA